jgi:hypothetical protein
MEMAVEAVEPDVSEAVMATHQQIKQERRQEAPAAISLGHPSSVLRPCQPSSVICLLPSVIRHLSSVIRHPPMTRFRTEGSKNEDKLLS